MEEKEAEAARLKQEDKDIMEEKVSRTILSWRLI